MTIKAQHGYGSVAGTNKSLTAVTGGPVIILVHPQLGENIGMVARAMLNCGLTQLRLVKPRDGWPNPMALSAAVGAVELVEKAVLFETLEQALADIVCVYATSARPRGLVKDILTPRSAAKALRGDLAAGNKAALVFGPERAGLTNEHLALAAAVVQVPLNPAFSSLNLAQAVLLLGYEWFLSGAPEVSEGLEYNSGRPATQKEMQAMYQRMETMLDDCGFLFPPEKRPSMINNIRGIFARAKMSEQEVRTFQGILTALWQHPRMVKPDQESE